MQHFLGALALLLLSTLYYSHGEETKLAYTSGKNRGETLAIETNSELVSSSSLLDHKNSDTASKCSHDGSMCLTCRSVGMCKGGILTEVQCRGLYPYCDSRTGSCTNERRRCKEDERSMTCPGQGYYPDSQSCRAFHVCEGDPMTSYKFTCAPLQVYSHEEKKCSRPSFRVRCVSFSCFGKQGRYTPYPSDRSIYTLCADAAATELFKCPENQQFDETKQKCIPSCTTEDNMADIDDETCKKYYRCVKSGTKFEAVPSSCPGQRVFDSEQLKCVSKTASFKCPYPLIGSSLTTTIPPPNENGESIIENEETFFRQNSQEEKENTAQNTPQVEKSASIIGSVQHKEQIIHTAEEDKVQNMMVKENDSQFRTNESKGTISTTNGDSKTTATTSQDNVDAVVSMLTDSRLRKESRTELPSKTVVRETGITKPDVMPLTKTTDSFMTLKIDESKMAVSTEKMNTVSFIPPLSTQSLHSDLPSQPKFDTINENLKDNTKVATTITSLKGQTYKVTTDEIMHTHKMKLTDSSTPHHNIQNNEPTISTPTIDKRVDIQIKESNTLPTQIFHTENSSINIEKMPTNTDSISSALSNHPTEKITIK